MKINFKPTISQIIVGVVALVLFTSAFAGVNALVSTLCLSSIPGESVASCNGETPVITGNATVTPASGTAAAPTPTEQVAIPDQNLPAKWDGASRVNLLVMGLDTAVATDAQGNIIPSSPDRTGPPHSDTMIVLTLDPRTKTAGMVSIPRDLWVNIPGYGYSRINTAYANGVGDKLPGGGPRLAMRTVEQLLGIQIQYYAQVEFWAFSKFIDDIGKIHVFVPKKIKIDPIGPGADDWVVSAGWHWLNGSRALAYVRNRHTENGDTDRSQRQQDVILAIRNQIASPQNFPYLVSNASYLYNDIQAGIDTNLTLDQMMQLGMLAKDIPPKTIQRGVIDKTMITFEHVTLGGAPADVLKPIPDKIRELRDEIFSTGGAASPLAKGANALALVKQEGATVIVLNGSLTSGIALKTGDYLKTQGIKVINNGNANQSTSVTKIIDHTGRPYILKYLKELFKIGSSAQIISAYDPAAAADIEIIIGDDWVAQNPMPK